MSTQKKVTFLMFPLSRFFALLWPLPIHATDSCMDGTADALLQHFNALEYSYNTELQYSTHSIYRYAKVLIQYCTKPQYAHNSEIH